MGTSLSSLGASGSTIGPGLGDIPESCVACVFLYLTPPEICNLARLNRAFRGAASSDSVWEAKLPRNYQDLLDLVPPERHRNLSKKDIFALLARPLPFDDGHKVGGALQVSFFVQLGAAGTFRVFVDGLWFCRKCGWTGSREGFACRFRRGRWRLLELMTGDTGIGFLLKNLGQIYLSLKLYHEKVEGYTDDNVFLV